MLIMLSSLIQSCGVQSALTGVWQQVEFSADPGSLYELHLGQYGDQLTGLVVRYQRPASSELAAYEKLDRCDCFFIRQGRVAEDKISFRLFNPQMRRSVNGELSCEAPPAECARVFELSESEDGDLIGESWCEGQREESVPLKLISTDAVPIERCWIPESEPDVSMSPLYTTPPTYDARKR